MVPETNKARNSSMFADSATKVQFDENTLKAYQTEAVEVTLKEKNLSSSRGKARKIENDDDGRVQSSSNASGSQRRADVFKGMRFCFSESFPMDKVQGQHYRFFLNLILNVSSGKSCFSLSGS